MRARGAIMRHALVLASLLVSGSVYQTTPACGATLQPATAEAWETYVRLTEKRIGSELSAPEGFLVQDFMPEGEARECRRVMGSGGICVVRLETRGESGETVAIPEGLVHHWLGAVFVPAVRLEDLVGWAQTYQEHERYFDDIEASRLLSRDGDRFHVLLRLKRRRIVTVHYNTEHRVIYERRDDHRVFSSSVATRIAQIENPGTPEEREMPVGQDSGFLWRLNSYWRYQEVEGGVVVECESLSLSRSVPAPVRWLVAGYVESVPRESMASTLGAIRRAMTSPPAASTGSRGRVSLYRKSLHSEPTAFMCSDGYMPHDTEAPIGSRTP